MRSPIDVEKAHHYDRCRESVDSDDYPSPPSIDEAKQSLTENTASAPPPPPPPYSAFSINRRRFILGVVTAAGFFGPLCGAVYLPSLKLFQHVFKTSETAVNGTVSIYQLVFAIAPLFGAAASDVGGRKTVYIVGFGSFLIANTLLALLPAHIVLLYFLRIFQAFGSCIVFSVGAGTVADITEPARRASALAWFLMGPQLGPILGPLIGGQFATESRWRWVFGILSLTSLPVYLGILLSMPETLRSLVGNGAAVAHQPCISIPKFRTKPCIDSKVSKAPRPSFRKFMHLLKYPPHLIVSINGALQFAGLYGMYISFPTIWQDGYNWTTAEVGYAFLCPGIAMFITSIFVGRFSDYMRKKAIANSSDGKIAPERRIAMQIPAFVVAGAGKIMFGWFTQNRVHPAAGLFSAAVASAGVSVVFVTSISYQTECDPAQKASLVALGGCLRNIAAAICAAIMVSCFRGLGWGWAFTGLGILDLLCIPGIILIMVRGVKFREALKREQQLNK
ncbi:MFS general substrate transporter [Clathrospora elynae]|uniref:MFS general substrate transporter n=1 Tax=Clathrospora elynae TaxID=706981 RepID=A0A6A5SSI9_9PLEO|nr:MFS general substrate transporter [Clathrospora elynae]